MDVGFAAKENTEEALWTCHTSINSEYRRILGKLKQSSHAVERRKVDKSYNNFLRIAQKFYKGYIQRLSARYDVPVLKRVADGIDVEPMQGGDRISPVPQDLEALVLRSCHATLLRLGDLSRYRTQARRKNSGYETALTFYSLAQHLMPQSGFAHHQMGMVHLEQGNHLDVVYHFHRAWAVEPPHPNARSNLEAEFKSLQLPASSKSRQNNVVPQDAFAMWFVRLHALFSKGEAFPQQAELEGEVMHRLEMACRGKKSAENLLKMSLVNIAAHYVASKCHAESRTATSSRYLDFTFRFNVLFFQTFIGVFEAELKQSMADGQQQEGNDADRSDQLSLATSLLPIMRIYGGWVVAHHAEIFSTGQKLGAIVPTLLQNLAKTFTSLCEFTYRYKDPKSCPYLFTEDVEIQGFAPLSAAIMPPACRGTFGQDGSRVQLYDSRNRLPPNEEALARVVDILRCAYFLTEQEGVPLQCHAETGQLIFECSSVPSPMRGQAPQSTPVLRPRNRSPAIASPRETQQQEAPETRDQLRAAMTPPDIDSGPRRPMSPGDEAHLEDTENTVIDMLTPFLKPPTPQPRDHTLQGQNGDKLASAVSHSPQAAWTGASNTVNKSRVSSLPWEWFQAPKPGPSAQCTPSQTYASAQGSPYYSPRSLLQGDKRLDDPFETPNRGSHGAFASDNHATDNPAEAAHRNQLLHALSSKDLPRSSPFSQWGESQRASRQQTGPAVSPWAPRFPDSGAPSSMGHSAFSHPSSLYQGTPAHQDAGFGLGLGVVPRTETNTTSRYTSPAQGNGGASSTPRLQMDDTAFSYNAAILQAAYQEKK